jgi:hypothetical protein
LFLKRDNFEQLFFPQKIFFQCNLCLHLPILRLRLGQGCGSIFGGRDPGDVRPMTAGRDHGRDSTRRRTPCGIDSDDLHIRKAPRSQEFPCDVPDRAIPHQPDCLRPGIVS